MNSQNNTPEKKTLSGTPARPLTLHLDMEKYLGQIEDWNASEGQKRDFIAALWNLLRTFAEIGYEIHPVQQAQNACGQLSENPPKAAREAPDTLYSRDNNHAKIRKDFGASVTSETERIRT